MDGEGTKAPDKLTRAEKPRLLVVEGKDEQLFFEAFLKHMAIEEVQVLDVGGKTRFKARLAFLAASPGFAETVASMGVLRDANDDPDGAFQSVSDALNAAGLPFPKSPLEFVGGRPRVGVMILPGDGRRGMLEDLCLQAVTNDPAMACVSEYFGCLEKAGFPLARNPSKARVQVFLASRKEAGKHPGQAAAAGYFPFDEKAFDSVKRFLRQLVSQPAAP